MYVLFADRRAKRSRYLAAARGLGGSASNKYVIWRSVRELSICCQRLILARGSPLYEQCLTLRYLLQTLSPASPPMISAHLRYSPQILPCKLGDSVRNALSNVRLAYVRLNTVGHLGWSITDKCTNQGAGRCGKQLNIRSPVAMRLLHSSYPTTPSNPPSHSLASSAPSNCSLTLVLYPLPRFV